MSYKEHLAFHTFWSNYMTWIDYNHMHFPSVSWKLCSRLIHLLLRAGPKNVWIQSSVWRMWSCEKRSWCMSFSLLCVCLLPYIIVCDHCTRCLLSQFLLFNISSLIQLDFKSSKDLFSLVRDTTLSESITIFLCDWIRFIFLPTSVGHSHQTE